MSPRSRMHELLQPAEAGDRKSFALDVFLIVLILADVTTIALNTVPELSAVYHRTFLFIELLALCVFAVEYVLRLWSAPEDERYAESSGRIDETDSGMGVEQRLSKEQSLRDLLLEQLQMDVDDPTDRIIGLHLIDQLDEAGYLVADFPALAQMLGCEVSRIEATLERLQRFEPSGVFARDLRECLALQLAGIDPIVVAVEQRDKTPARRPQAARHHLGPSVVSVEARLRNEYAEVPLAHRSESLAITRR